MEVLITQSAEYITAGMNVKVLNNTTATTMYSLRIVPFFALMFLSTHAAITPEDIVRFGEARQHCRATINVDRAVISRALRGDRVNDRQFDCYMACLMQGLHLANPDGSLNSQVAIDKIPDTIDSRSTIVNAINLCSQKKGSEPCSTAHELFNCIHDNRIPEILLG